MTMKNRIVMSLMALILGLSANFEKTGIQGLVISQETNEPVHFATLALYKDGELVGVGESDINGRYSITNLPAGTYNVECQHIGFSNERQVGVSVNYKEMVNLDFHMAEDRTVLDEVVVVEYKVPLIDLDYTTSGSVISYENCFGSTKVSAKRKKALPTKTISALTATTAGVSVSSADVISVRGSRSDKTFYYIDGVRVKNKVSDLIPDATIESLIVIEEEVVAKESVVKVKETSVTIEAGLLTAAEWNDLDNWIDWEDLTRDGVYKSMKDHWGLPIGERESVFLTNDNNIPLVNVQVQLLDSKDSILWSTITDNTGKAELWHPQTSADDTYILVNKSSESEDIVSTEDSEYGIHITSNQSCQEWQGMDVMFVVDATSSMHDEIEFLQAELEDIINRSSNNNIPIRTGAVFYKDKFDDYLTQTSHLTSDINETLDFITTRTISGGGDYPEAMDSGLANALEEEWNKDALSRIIFLLLDAPPHDDAEVLHRLADQVRIAAEKGIKIIPITASGIDRETEYLMKQMALMTNGTYVFLTDDSGIGNPHLEHVLPDYKVEKLNDLITRLIENYSKQLPCQIVSDAPQIVNNDKDEDRIKLSVFPNPTSDIVNVKIDGNVDEVALVSGTGRQIEIQKVKEGEDLIFDTKDLVSGMYSLLFYYEDEIIDSKSIIVVK